jgi:hypothetical protein
LIAWLMTIFLHADWNSSGALLNASTVAIWVMSVTGSVSYRDGEIAVGAG